MKFLREIPIDKITNNLLDLEQEGFTLVWKQDSIEIWYEMTPEEKAVRESAVRIAA